MRNSGFPWARSVAAVAVTASVFLLWWWATSLGTNQAAVSVDSAVSQPSSLPGVTVPQSDVADGAAVGREQLADSAAVSGGPQADGGDINGSGTATQVDVPAGVELPLDVVTVRRVESAADRVTVLASTSLDATATVAALEQHWLRAQWQILGSDSRSVTGTNLRGDVVTASMLELESIASVSSDLGPSVNLSDGLGTQTWILISVLRTP